MAYLDRQAVLQLGLASVGEHVLISDKASIHGASRVHLGDHVRIDDFCVLSAGAGGIFVGRHVHVAVGSTLIGAGRIQLSDFCNLSSRVSIYSSNDDYSGLHMTNPTVPEAFTGVVHAEVFLGRHVIIGCGSVVLPGVRLEEGAAVGALSLVKADCQSFGMYAGQPARYVKARSRRLLELEERFLAGRPS